MARGFCGFALFIFLDRSAEQSGHLFVTRGKETQPETRSSGESQNLSDTCSLATSGNGHSLASLKIRDFITRTTILVHHRVCNCKLCMRVACNRSECLG